MVDYSTAQHLASSLGCVFRFPDCELPQQGRGRGGDDKDSGGLVSLELFLQAMVFSELQVWLDCCNFFFFGFPGCVLR